MEVGGCSGAGWFKVKCLPLDLSSGPDPDQGHEFKSRVGLWMGFHVGYEAYFLKNAVGDGHGY